MYFSTYKNAVIYSFKELPEQLLDAEVLQAELEKRRHSPITAQAEESQGFCHPFFAENDDRLAMQFDRYLHLSYIKESKMIDQATIDAKVKEAENKAADEGRALDSETKNSLSQQFKSELMPFFRVTRQSVSGYVDFQRMLFIVNTASIEQAESFIRCLRTTLGSFHVTLLRVDSKPCQALSVLVDKEKSPDNLCFDEEGKLKAKNKPGKDVEKQSVNLQGFSVEDESVRSILKDLNVIYCDLYATVPTQEGEKYLSFGLSSPADGVNKRNPDILLKAFQIGMPKVSYNDDVPAAVFECCTYIGIIIDRVVSAFGGCEETNYMNGVFSSQESLEKDLVTISESTPKDDGIDDELFDKAKSFVASSRRASVSGLQRQFKIGYNRAARIIDAMESMGIVSSPSGDGLRDVLIADEEAA